MPVTVAQVAGLSQLRLRVAAGASGLDHAVRWVHVSEFPDPTPWLRGGELLLTSGLRIDDTAQFRPYVNRLADAQLAGLGFGVGMPYETIPREVLQTAEARGLPVLEVPIDSPYVAISEAVSDLLAAERYSAVTRAFDAQHAMTAAALSGGPAAIVTELARTLGGWAAVADAAAESVTLASSPQAREHCREMLPDVARNRDRDIRSAALAGPADHTLILGLGQPAGSRGHLVVGVPGPATEFGRMTAAAAVSLLSLELERARASDLRARRVRGELLAQALRGQLRPEEFAYHASTWNLDADRVRAGVIRAARSGSDLRTAVDHALAEARVRAVTAYAAPPDPAGPAELAVLTGAREAPARILAEIASTHAGTHLGLSDAVGVGDALRAFESARHAARLGAAQGRTVTRFDEIEPIRLLLHAQPGGQLEDFVARALGPLGDTGAEAAGMRATLEAFLSTNGQWNATAERLQVHRHTIRTRVEHIEQALGRSLSSPDVRTELWLALVAHRTLLGRGRTATGST